MDNIFLNNIPYELLECIRGGIIKTPCPDCGGQIHHEVFVGSNRNPTSYSKYDCIGDRELYIGYDATSLVNSARGFDFLPRVYSWDSSVGNPTRHLITPAVNLRVR